MNTPTFRQKLSSYVMRCPQGTIWQTRYICFPLALIFATLSLAEQDLSFAMRSVFFLLGIFSWTFCEYILHRWVLHWRGEGLIVNAVMDRLHRIHHQDPADKLQVCLPWFMCLVIWSVMAGIFLAFGVPWDVARLFVSGFALMMVIYDITHFSAHYMPATNRLLKSLKTHHLNHHAQNDAKRFGVTSPIWDWVFRTM